MQGGFIKWRLPKRYVIVIMVFIGYMHHLCIHTNIGMAVVEMTSPKKISHGNGTIEMKADYDWSPQQRALVLSSFSYGRLIAPVGGTLAGRFGGGTVYGVGILGNAFITTLTPFFLQLNFYVFVVTTALTGTFESISYSSTVLLWAKWTPLDERAKCISVSIIGAYAGSIASFVVAGWVLRRWGWTMLFYASGIEFFIWFGLWTLVVKNDPSKDTHMSDEERKYIKNKLNTSDSSNEKLVYPWKAIFTCLPFWAGCLCKFCIGGGYTISTLYLPQYIKDISDLDIETIGYISVIPQVFSVISMPLFGYLSDYTRSNKLLSLTNGHKLNISIGLLSATVAFFAAGLWSNFTACIISMCLFQFFTPCLVLDMHVLVLDLAPRYSAFMHSVGYTFYAAGGFLAPIFVGFFVTSHAQSQWSACFLAVSGVHLVVALIFLKFGSGELQPWADYKLTKPNDRSIQNTNTEGLSIPK